MMTKYSLRKKVLVLAISAVALVAIVYTLDRLPDWLEDYSQYRTDIVMNRISEYSCSDSPEGGEIRGYLPTPTYMADVQVKKEKTGWIEITVYPKAGDDRPTVRFYNTFSPMCCWGYEIIWHGGVDASKTDKYVRQARRDALANINMVTRDFPGNLLPF